MSTNDENLVKFAPVSLVAVIFSGICQFLPSLVTLEISVVTGPILIKFVATILPLNIFES